MGGRERERERELTRKSVGEGGEKDKRKRTRERESEREREKKRERTRRVKERARAMRKRQAPMWCGSGVCSGGAEGAYQGKWAHTWWWWWQQLGPLGSARAWGRTRLHSIGNGGCTGEWGVLGEGNKGEPLVEV